MTETERELWEALQELLCCPAFNGQVFMHDRESHRAWTLARDVAERHRPPPEPESRRGIRLREGHELLCLKCGGIFMSMPGANEDGVCPGCGSDETKVWGGLAEEVPPFLRKQAE